MYNIYARIHSYHVHDFIHKEQPVFSEERAAMRVHNMGRHSLKGQRMRIDLGLYTHPFSPSTSLSMLLKSRRIQMCKFENIHTIPCSRTHQTFRRSTHTCVATACLDASTGSTPFQFESLGACARMFADTTCDCVDGLAGSV